MSCTVPLSIFARAASSSNAISWPSFCISALRCVVLLPGHAIASVRPRDRPDRVLRCSVSRDASPAKLRAHVTEGDETRACRFRGTWAPSRRHVTDTLTFKCEARVLSRPVLVCTLDS
eukprot:2722006-Rhodomonas_salina.1